MEYELTIQIVPWRIDFPDYEYMMFLRRLRNVDVREKHVVLCLKEIFISEYTKMMEEKRDEIHQKICWYMFTPCVFIEMFGHRMEDILRGILNGSDEEINLRYVAHILNLGNDELVSKMLMKYKTIKYEYIVKELIDIPLNYNYTAFDKLIEIGFGVDRIIFVLNRMMQDTDDIYCPSNGKIRLVINYLNKKNEFYFPIFKTPTMESFANILAYGITFAVTTTLSVGVAETPLSPFGLAFASMVACAVPFSDAPLKYTQLAYAGGYLFGIALYVAMRALKKTETRQD